MVPSKRARGAGARISPGPSIDAEGSPVEDPTDNVKSIFATWTVHAAELRASDIKFSESIRASNLALVNKMAEAETRRINDLTCLREKYELRIAADLATNVRSIHEHLAGQLIKETSSLGNQIVTLKTTTDAQLNTLSSNMYKQIETLRAEISPRLGELDKFRFETGGRTSVQDPATSDALHHLMTSLGANKSALDANGGIRDGMASLVGWIFGALMTAVAVTTLIYTMVH